jgi:integrase
LNWEDVDLDGSKLSVRRSLKVTDRGLAFCRAKNKASRRSEPLNRSAVAVLIAHRLRQNEERLRLGELWKDHSLVFPNRVGKPINHSNLYKRKFTVLLEKAGMQNQGFTLAGRANRRVAYVPRDARGSVDYWLRTITRT